MRLPLLEIEDGYRMFIWVGPHGDLVQTSDSRVYFVILRYMTAGVAAFP
jgi:hypothetical protein